MTRRKFEAPELTLTELACRACGQPRALDMFRLYATKPEQLHMDFCVECEKREGTLALYRRYAAYATPAIAEAVFSCSRVPVARRTPDQTRLLVEAKPEREPTSNEELIQQELAQREMARRRLLYFVKKMMPNYLPGWVHQDICRRLEKFMRDVEEEKSPRLILAVPPRHGKLCADSTPVLATAGWTTHGALKPGDFVFHPSGRPVEVLGVSAPDMATVEVELTDGAVIKVHPAHEWTVFDRRKHRWRTVETSELATAALTHGEIGVRGGRYMYQLPLIAPLEFPEAALPMAPYALGAWLGDGTSTKPWITHAKGDAPVIDAITACGYAPSRVYVHRTTGVHSTVFAGPRPNVPSVFWRQLRALSLVGNKHIPAPYFQASVQQRLELLAGLIDTDGSVGKDGRVRFTTAMPQLAHDVERLARELGMRPYTQVVAPTTSTSGIVGRKNVYVVCFVPPVPVPTRLPRKRIEGKPQKRLAIKAVRAAPPEKGRCIQVDSPDGLYLVGHNLTPTHNSQLASDMFPSWVLGHHPDWPIIVSSYAQELPIQFSRNIRDRLADPEYRAVFPDTAVRQDAKGVEAWKTTKDGGIKAIGVGGGLTGFGGRILIADDLIKDAEAAASELILQNTWNWYQMVFRSRVAPGGGILLIGTRWHWHDPTGRALEIDEELKKAGVPEWERENWEVISYPAIAEHDEYLMPDGRIELEADPEQALRLLRKAGDALHPERYPIAELRKIKNNYTVSNWSALYQQNPTPAAGDFFLRDDLRYRWLDPAYRSLCRRFITVDYAIGKKQRNDFTVMGAWALDAEDNLYLLEVRRGRWGTRDIARNVAALACAHDAEIYAGEMGAIHHAVWPEIQKELDKNRKYLTVDESLVPIQDKETRARPLQGRLQRHKLFFSYDTAVRPDIYDITEREMLQFPNGANDDIVDMMAWGARLALNISLPTTQAPPKKASWQDKLTTATTPQSHMAA